MVGPATVSLRMCAAPLLDLALAVVEVAKLAPMRRILLTAVAAVLLLAVGTRAADALGVGGDRLRCGCVETCWCKRPGLTVFRWVTPGRWHHIGLTAEEKQSRHSQA